MLQLRFLLVTAAACGMVLSAGYEWPSVAFREPRECSANETYDAATFTCVRCPENAERQPDGLGCRCKSGRAEVHSDSTPASVSTTAMPTTKQCQACPNGLTPSREKDGCIACPNASCSCESNQIRVERGSDGLLLSRAECVSCASGFRPSTSGDACEACPRGDCNCTRNDRLDTCLPANLGTAERYTPSPKDEVVRFSGLEVQSVFFKEHVPAAAYMCYKQRDSSGCQLLANLCAMAMHELGHPACDLVYALTMRDRWDRVPHLYFSDRMTASVTKEEEISNVYGQRSDQGRSQLNVTAVSFSLGGKLLDVQDVNGAMLQLCNGSFAEFEAAFNFGTRYRRRCKVPARQLFAHGEPVFYDLYIAFNASTAGVEERKMYALPVLLKNYGNNKDPDASKWVYTTRLFLVDTVSGVSTADSEEGLAQPAVVRYMSKINIRVELVNTREFADKAGRIFPPVIAVEYAEVTLQDLKDGRQVEFEFTVDYEMSMKEAKKDIEIAVGVLSVFAVLWSVVETWSWSRRSGKMSVDAVTLAKFLANNCANLAMVFLAVVFFTCFYWFIFFKHQTFTHVMLPSEEQEQLIKQYVISIFALKIVDVVHLILSQVTVDVFLLDWERPHPTADGSSSKDPSVSVWRTYLVANEWNELQAKRKTHLALQIFIVVFILRVCGVEGLASADPSAIIVDTTESHIPFSFICRFALGSCIYLSVAALQVIFWRGIYARLVADDLEQFVDICSLSNISLFIMANSNFGYYIHGKSAHGYADTDMATLIEQLQREADDFCGHRGLQAGSDQQTFIMSLPSRLRGFYDKIISPAIGSTMTGRAQSLSSANVKHVVDSYSTMNRFLARFLEHALRDLDYEVREKLFLEKVLDVEFQDADLTERAIFYTDTTHAFESVLLSGREFSLVIFDMMVFLFVDLLVQDFLLAGIITYIVAELVRYVRYLGGKVNLARKTLIDKRFLI